MDRENMKRLYFRIVLTVLIVLGISIFLPGLMLRLFDPWEGAESAPPLSRETLDMLRRHLESVPPGQLATTVDSLSPILGYKLALKYNPQQQVAPPSGAAPLHGLTPGPGPIGLGSRPRPNGPPQTIHLASTGKEVVVLPVNGSPKPPTTALVALVSLLLAITGIAGFIVIAPTIRNLRRLEITALRFSMGDLTARAAVPGSNAVGSVARQFNIMADGIQEKIERERQLLQAVSHELRTPVARLRFSLNFLRQSVDESERDQSLQEMDEEINEIDALVKELVGYNRMSDSETQLAPEYIDAAKMVADMVSCVRPFQQGITVEFTPIGGHSCSLFADPAQCRRVVQNLLLNALRHAHSQVYVCTERRETEAVISVSDDGPGIPESQRDRIFHPFVRVDDSRSKESGGVGLGLAIVDRIMRLHGGSVTLEQSGAGGARFVTTWPDQTIHHPPS
jgi:signal transduction histidine kinase